MKGINGLLSGILVLCAGVAWAYNPATFQEHTIEQSQFYLDESDADIGRLYIRYVEVGPVDGPVIFLLHGVPTSSWSFRRVSANLAALGYRVIAPDLLGFGNSAKPKAEEYYNLEQQGRRMLALMDYLQIDTWTQVLHDVGGLVTWEMMALDADRIERLVMLNTFAYEEGWHPPKSLDNPLVKFSMGIIGFKSRTVIRNTICGMLALPDDIDNDVSLAGYYEPLENGADRAYLAFMTSFDRVRERLGFYQETLRGSRTPAIIIWGGLDDTLVGVEAIPLFAEDLDIPPANIFLRNDAKHLVMEEIPQFIVDRILLFVPLSS
jgi:haloalkane dehalogenase